MRHRFSAVAVLAIACTFSSGCGALVFRNPEEIVVTCNVPGAVAKASADGRSCPTPGRLQLDRNKDHFVTVTAEGYEPETVRIDSHLSWWRAAVSVVLNASWGWPVFFIPALMGCTVDIAAGAWQALEPDEVHVELVAKKPAVDERPKPERAPIETPQVVPSAPAPRSCPTCGARVEHGARLCVRCGAKQ